MHASVDGAEDKKEGVFLSFMRLETLHALGAVFRPRSLEGSPEILRGQDEVFRRHKKGNLFYVLGCWAVPRGRFYFEGGTRVLERYCNIAIWVKNVIGGRHCVFCVLRTIQLKCVLVKNIVKVS